MAVILLILDPDGWVVEDFDSYPDGQMQDYETPLGVWAGATNTPDAYYILDGALHDDNSYNANNISFEISSDANVYHGTGVETISYDYTLAPYSSNIPYGITDWNQITFLFVHTGMPYIPQGCMVGSAKLPILMTQAVFTSTNWMMASSITART